MLDFIVASMLLAIVPISVQDGTFLSDEYACYHIDKTMESTMSQWVKAVENEKRWTETKHKTLYYHYSFTRNYYEHSYVELIKFKREVCND
jgi:hypothetical protein